VAGGFLNSWQDEWWKTVVSTKVCWSWQPYGSVGFDPTQCEVKAHVDCPNKDINKPNLCGFWMEAPYDQYVNEGWWGIMRPSHTSSSVQSQSPASLPSSFPLASIDHLQPRMVYSQLQILWTGPFTRSFSLLSIMALVFAVAVCVALAFMYWLKLRRQSQSAEKAALDERTHLLSPVRLHVSQVDMKSPSAV